MRGNSDGKASPGQPFAAPKAEIWNGMIDAGNAYRADKLTNGTPRHTRPRDTDIIRLENTSGAERARGEILRISGKAITDLSDEHIWLGGVATTDDDYFGILKEPIEDDSVGRVQVSGCCMAMIDITDADHLRAKSVAASYVLESADDGPIEILYAPAGTGELECVVRFAGGGGGGTGGVIEYKIVSLTTKASGPYTGLKAASVIVHGAPCSRPGLIGTTVEVIDHSNELFDETSMVGYTGWASEMRFLSLAVGADCETLTPCHWVAINRVCDPDTGTYAAACP